MKSAKIFKTTVLVLDETNTLSFAAAVDPMRAANRQAGRPVFEWQFATPTATDVTLTSGLTVPATPLHTCTVCDLLIIVAGFNVEAQVTTLVQASLRRLAKHARFIAGVDGGPWVMAQAGLLDGHRATTHWEDLGRFERRFDSVTTIDARFVDSGTRLTSGGAAPALEMMLHFIRRHFGPDLSNRVAGSFIYDAVQRPARPQMRRNAHNGHSAMTARAHDMMQTHLEDPIPVASIARQLGVSLRALQLQFKRHVGLSPQAHYLALRLAEADRLVTQTRLPLQDIALITGFNAQSGFARAYNKQFGVCARQRRSGQTSANTASDAGGERHQSQPTPHRLT